MAEANTMDTLNGLFKQVYADKIKDLIPDGVKLIKRIPFQGQEKRPGAAFNCPVILGHEHGVSFGDPDDGAFALNAPVAGQVKNAQVKGYQMVLRSSLSYAVLSRSASSGPRAFEQATKHVVANMLRSAYKILEIEMLYGQKGLGEVSAVAANVATITTAEWAPGIWAGGKNMPIEFRSSAGVLRGNANVTAVNLSTREITVDAMPAGVVATDVIRRKGAYGKEFAGAQAIIENTGTLFEINAADYELWSGNTYGAAGALSFNKIQNALTKAVEKGLESDVLVLVNPKTWASLLNDQAALRSFDASYKSEVAENGSRSIKFHGQNGMIEIEPSIYVKEGYAFILALDELMRVGSTDVTFKLPDSNDQFFRQLQDNAGVELRLYTDQALFCSAPGKLVLINGIS